MSTLVIADDAGKVLRRIDLYGLDRLTIGRSTQRDLIINDPAISRFHCILYFEGGAWCIADAGSRSGTRIDGHPIVWKRLLRGRTATIGHYRLTIESPDQVTGSALQFSHIPNGALAGNGGGGALDDRISLGFPGAAEAGHEDDDACGRTSVFLSTETDFLPSADRIEDAGR